MLLLPITRAFERDVNPPVAVRAAREHRLATEADVTKDTRCGFEPGEHLVVRSPLSLARLVVLEDMGCRLLQYRGGDRQEVGDGRVELLLFPILVVAFDDDSASVAKDGD